MFLIYFVTVVLFITIQQTTAKSSPVLIYGIKLPSKNVFPKIEKQEFEQMMAEHLKSHTFFLILVKNFSARQLSCPGSECLEEFPSGIEYTYYAAVEDPHLALEELFHATTSPLYVDKGGHFEEPILCEDDYRKKLHIVQRRGKDDSDTDLLQQRTEILHSIQTSLANCGYPPLFFLMDSMDGIEYNDGRENSTLLVKSISTTIVDNLVVIDVVTKAHKLFDQTEAELKNLTIRILRNKGRYTTVNATYDGEEFAGPKLIWPRVFVLDAPGNTFVNGNKTLRLNKLKLEKFSGYDNFTKELETNEDDWYTCVYVTPGMIMGMVVAAILCSILCFGLAMIMDIKTNDRFDGPEMQALQFTTADN